MGVAATRDLAPTLKVTRSLSGRLRQLDAETYVRFQAAQRETLRALSRLLSAADHTDFVACFFGIELAVKFNRRHECFFICGFVDHDFEPTSPGGGLIPNAPCAPTAHYVQAVGIDIAWAAERVLTEQASLSSIIVEALAADGGITFAVAGIQHGDIDHMRTKAHPDEISDIWILRHASDDLLSARLLIARPGSRVVAITVSGDT